ncbi:MAG TPA: hypothetical protein VGG28_22090 [Kofleriaceae bacterium]|jgi:hypothetical protein
MTASAMKWLVLAVLSISVVASADDKAQCSYLEISATNGSTPAFDPDLQQVEKKLHMPPLNAWNTFHKLSGGPFPLEKQKAESLKLAQGAASILLRDRTDKRLELTVSVDGADGKRVLDNKQNVNVGDWVMFGHNVKNDGHILAVTCR